MCLIAAFRIFKLTKGREFRGDERKMTAFSVDSLPVSLWANGKGETRVVAIHPPASDISNFLWRISIATLRESSTSVTPFSVFDGVERHIALVSGSGAILWDLEGGDSPREAFSMTTPGVSFGFDGGAKMGSTPVPSASVGAESRDFNLMIRRQWPTGLTAHGHMERIELRDDAHCQLLSLLPSLSGAVEAACCLVLDGRCSLRLPSRDAVELQPFDGAMFASGDLTREVLADTSLSGKGVLILAVVCSVQ